MNNISIPQTNPKASYSSYKEEIDKAIATVLDSGWYILGNEVESFEKEFTSYLGTKYAVGTGSGTDALHLALRTLGIGEGDVVLTVSHTAVATVAAIELAGATPVFVDIDPLTFNMDSNCLEDVLKKLKSCSHKLKAIVPVHLYGQTADMDSIMDIASRLGLYVIEDCAQAHGAMLKKQKAGTWGHMAAFSFYPTKNLGTLGDGGALVTNDHKLYDKARILREYGWKERYISSIPGMNTRLDEIQAAILRVKLRHLDTDNEKRQTLAQKYDQLLPEIINLPKPIPQTKHVYHQYVIRTSHRDALREYLTRQGVGTAIHYPVPVHLQPAYKDRIIHAAKLPLTENVAKEILSLPMYPELTDDQLSSICKIITNWKLPEKG